MSSSFDVRQDGAIARVTINRPDKGNMLTLAMVDELAGLVAKSGADPDTKAIVLTGAGKDFCRGRDPAGAPEGQPTTALAMRRVLIEPILGVYAAVRGAEVPVIAAVSGAALGFGCATAAVCDVTIAAEDARFALPEMRHDLPPTLAMCAHLDRVATKGLLYMVYSMNEIDARTALSLGIVSQVAPPGGIAAALDAFLGGLTARRRESIVTVKRYLQRARLAEPQAAADLAGNMLSVVLSSK